MAVAVTAAAVAAAASVNNKATHIHKRVLLPSAHHTVTYSLTHSLLLTSTRSIWIFNFDSSMSLITLIVCVYVVYVCVPMLVVMCFNMYAIHLMYMLERVYAELNRTDKHTHTQKHGYSIQQFNANGRMRVASKINNNFIQTKRYLISFYTHMHWLGNDMIYTIPHSVQLWIELQAKTLWTKHNQRDFFSFNLGWHSFLTIFDSWNDCKREWNFELETKIVVVVDWMEWDFGQQQHWHSHANISQIRYDCFNASMRYWLSK